MQLDPESPPHLPGQCLNCGTTLTGRFCHQCGQLDFDFRRSFWSMLHDALESLFHVDGRFIRSVIELLFIPGRLTRAFLLGRRASQVPPLRFYLFITLLFFLTLPLRTDFTVPELRLPDSAQAGATAMNQSTARPDVPNPWTEFVEGMRSAFDEDDLAERFRAPTREELLDLIVNYTPKLLFVLLPLLALGTRILYWRSGYSYLEHLVVALHLGTFFFTFTLMVEGWSLLLAFLWSPLATLFSAAALGYGLLYLPLMLRRVFPRGIWGTLWRTSLLYIAGGTIMFGIIITLAVVFISRSGLLN